jgi:ABC-type branched-subunit amino acid transport system substrate-binding protein
MSRKFNRRQLLKSGAGVVGTVGLAGCSVSTDSGSDGSGDGSGGDGSSGDDSSSDGSDASAETTDEGSMSEETQTTEPTSMDSEPVVFGEPLMETAQFAFLLPGTNQAIDMAIKEANDFGGLMGSEVQISRRETGSKPSKFRSVVEQLINNDDAVCIIRATSTELTPNLEFITDKRVPLISNGAGSTALDDYGGDKGTPDDLSDDEWIWRTTASDSVSTAGGAKYMYDQGFERMAILNGNAQGERSWADGFESAFTEVGGEVAQRLEVQAQKTSYQSELSRLFESDFDAFAVSLKQGDATTLTQEWVNGGYGKQIFFDPAVMSDKFVDTVGDIASGAFTAGTSTSGPAYDSFIDRFREAGDADIHQWAQAGYDAMATALLAARRGGEVSPEAIEMNLSRIGNPPGTPVTSVTEGLEALEAGEEINYEGVLTPTNFTADGNVIGDVVISELQPDGFDAFTTLEAESLRSIFTS